MQIKFKILTSYTTELIAGIFSFFFMSLNTFGMYNSMYAYLRFFNRTVYLIIFFMPNNPHKQEFIYIYIICVS